MAILPGTASDGQVLATVTAVLVRHRKDLNDLNDLYTWTSAHSQADLVSLGMDSGTAAAVLAAVADAHAEYLIHSTGQAPGSYPQVTGTPYVYAASQAAIIGPLLS